MEKATAIAFLKKLADGNYTEAEYSRFLGFLDQCDTADYAEILDRWEQNFGAEGYVPKGGVRRFGVKQLVAAAAILVIVSTGVFLAIRGVQPDVRSSIEMAKTMLPGADQTLLTLSDGTQVPLDQLESGNLYDLGATQVVKGETGELSYEMVNGAMTDGPPTYHTITTARGGNFRIRLADGTTVWLNASSLLRFPSHFNGEQRIVELTGEGYFEVSHDPEKAFVVKTAEQSVTVLGTHFNINAYANEPNTITTVLDGSVRVETSSNTESGFGILKKGQQAQLDISSHEIRVTDVAAHTSVAWKNGRFQFNNTPIDEVMRHFSRWYDVDFEYTGNHPPVRLWGNINKNVNAAEALEIISFFGLEYDVVQKGDTKKVVVFNSNVN